MDFNAEALQRVQIVLQQRGDGFHQRAGDMALLVGQRQSVDDAAGVRIGLRRNGSRAMRKDDEAVANKDSYTMLMLFLTYDIMPKYRKCNN